MEQLKIQEKKGANYNLLELFGVLDSYNFTELQQKAIAFVKENNLVLDLSNLTSMDSSGLSAIFFPFNPLTPILFNFSTVISLCLPVNL